MFQKDTKQHYIKKIYKIAKNMVDPEKLLFFKLDCFAFARNDVDSMLYYNNIF